MASEGYNPSSAVQAAHNLPHMDDQGNTVSVIFSPLSGDYYLSIIRFPIIISVFTGILIVMFCISLIFLGFFRRCHCPCVYDSRILQSKDPHFFKEAERRLLRHRHLVRTLTIFIVCLLVINCFVWYSSSFATTSFYQFSKGLQSLQHILLGIDADIVGIINDMDGVIEGLATGSCYGPQFSSLSLHAQVQPLVDELNTVANEITSLTQPAVDLFTSLRAYITGQLVVDKDAIVGNFFAVIIFLGGCFATSVYFHLKTLFRFSIGVTGLVALTLFVVASMEMAILMLVGDYCMDPTGNILNLVNDAVLDYYLICKGDNPYAIFVDPVTEVLNSLQTSITQSTAKLPDCPDLLSSYFSDIDMRLISLVDTMTGCSAFNDAYKSFVYDAMCTSGFNALYTLWATQLSIAVILYFVMALSNAVYQSYVYVDKDTGIPLTLDELNKMKSALQVSGKPVSLLTMMYWPKVEQHNMEAKPRLLRMYPSRKGLYLQKLGKRSSSHVEQVQPNDNDTKYNDDDDLWVPVDDNVPQQSMKSIVKKGKGLVLVLDGKPVITAERLFDYVYSE